MPKPTQPIGDINRSQSTSEPSSMNMNAEELRENMDRFSSEIRDRASRMAKDVSSRAREYYSESNDWLQENYGKALAVVGVLAAAGMVGYMMARRSPSSEHKLESERS